MTETTPTPDDYDGDEIDVEPYEGAPDFDKNPAEEEQIDA